MTNAKLLVDKDGNTSYDSSSNKYIETKDGLLFEKVYGEYVLIAYLGSETTVTLPATIEGKTYTISNIRGVRDVILSEGFLNINDDAFSYCWSLTSITIPGSVKNIGNYAFAECCNLKTVNLGEGIESIGDEAFRGCYYIAEIILPDSVKSLGCFAFTNTDLNKLVIGAGIENLGDALAYSHICNIEVSKNNPTYKIIGKNLYSKDGKTFVYYAENWEVNTFTVPEGVEVIGDSAFSGCKALENFMIPDNVVKTIGERAFSNCESLTSITIPATVTYVGYRAFDSGCKSLTSIRVLASSSNRNKWEDRWNDTNITPSYS
jgi:hypothetical protein